jgi:hypothetical protein
MDVLPWVKDTGVEVEAADRWMLYPGWGIQEWRWKQLTDGCFTLGEGYRSGGESS